MHAAAMKWGILVHGLEIYTAKSAGQLERAGPEFALALSAMPEKEVLAEPGPGPVEIHAPISDTARSQVGKPAPRASAWSYTVSVRSLCEFTAKRGDLDRRFTPTATALEGLNGQVTVATRRGPAYQTEIALAGVFEQLRVRGRADGFDPATGCLEEVKTIRGHPDDIPANRRHLHWAQLETYGALFCRERGVQEVALALVYHDVESQSEIEVRQLSSAENLEAAFVTRCRSFLAWSRQEAEHRSRRDAALAVLVFPPGPFRPGQRGLAEAVYRAARDGSSLLAQAPTGIGKTLGTLFPMLRAMPQAGIDKIAYLTCKGTGRIVALQALERLRAGCAGSALRVIAMVAKDQACEHPDKACHGDSCPLAGGFYDRLPEARAAAVACGWLDQAALRRIALAHQVCPYYLGQELVRWCDVLVGDVHHAFDANGQLWGLTLAQEWRLALLVDEAHNLIDRVRAMYSAELGSAVLRSALKIAPASMRERLDDLLRALHDIAIEPPGDYAALDAVPDALMQGLQGLIAMLGEHFQRQPMAVGPLLNIHFELIRFQRLAESFGEHSLFEVKRSGARRATPASAFEAEVVRHTADADAIDVVLSIRNIVPARFTRPRFKRVHTTTLFSATLGPPAFQRDLLGLPADTGWIDVPPVFPAENLVVRIADRLSTRFPHRCRSLDALTHLMAAQLDAQPGNYLAFFSSFGYAHQAADRLANRRPDIAQWRQRKAMDSAARAEFLDRFEPLGAGIGFAVLGGVFAEGVDLPGSRLIGAFIATLGLPPVSPMQDQMRARLDQLFGEGHGYADLVPAMQKVVQAAGRVVRTPHDRGWVWLMDDRYGRPEVIELLPASWGLSAH